MRCPRCGEPMTGGICDNCGFPMTKVKTGSYLLIKRQWLMKHNKRRAVRND